MTAALLVASLVNYVLGRSRQATHQRAFLSIVLDEAQNFASNRLEILLAEGRRYNVALHLAHQHLHQMPTGLSHAIRNNCGHQFVFGCGAMDAPEFARGVVLDVPEDKEVPDVREILLTQGVGECILSRRGQKSVHLRVAPCPEPFASPARLQEFRDIANVSSARPRPELEANLREPHRFEPPITIASPRSRPEVRNGLRRSFAVED